MSRAERDVLMTVIARTVRNAVDLVADSTFAKMQTLLTFSTVSIQENPSMNQSERVILLNCFKYLYGWSCAVLNVIIVRDSLALSVIMGCSPDSREHAPHMAFSTWYAGMPS